MSCWSTAPLSMLLLSLSPRAGKSVLTETAQVDGTVH